jgi:hypothetical protein
MALVLLGMAIQRFNDQYMKSLCCQVASDVHSKMHCREQATT